MKVRRIVLCALAVLFLVFFADAAVIEGKQIVGDQSLFRIQELTACLADSETMLNNKFALKYPFYEVSALFHRLNGHNLVSGIYRLENGYLIKNGGPKEITESVEGFCLLDDYCKARGIPVVYVNLSHKFDDDSDLSQFGVENYTCSIEDAFLSELAERGAVSIDMRDYLDMRYDNHYEAFYKTDHHWKISTGLYCAQILSSQLNERFRLGLDTEAIADSNMSVTLLENAWVGELGKKTGSFYSGLDDFELILPLGETRFHLQIPQRSLDVEGDFSIMVDEDRLQNNGFWQKRYGPSFYYSYLFGNDGLQIIENYNQPAGRILVIKDSFAQAVNPFLAMTANKLVSWDLRDNDASLQDFIAQNDFDVVIVMYCSSMIGNTRQGQFMFDFS